MGPVAAARRKLEIEQQLQSEERPEAASHLMKEREALIAQHPDIDDLTSQRQVNEYSAGLDATRRREPRDTPIPAGRPTSTGRSAERRNGQQPSRSQSRPRARARPARRRGGSSKYLRQTGLPAATDSITRFIMGTAGALIGIALLYLLLTDAQQRGSGSAVSRITGGFASFVRNFVGQVDPLAKAKGDTSSSSSSGAQPGHQPLETFGGGLLGDAASFPDQINQGMVSPAPGVGNPPPTRPRVLPPGYRFSQTQLHPTTPGATAASIRAALGI